MKTKSIALVLYGEHTSTRNAFTDDNYKALAEALAASGFHVETVLYHASQAKQVENDLMRFDAALSWVNPQDRLARGDDHVNLDDILLHVAQKGVFVSTHPDVILKIGTKRVLYTTRGMDWCGDVQLYTDFEDFKNRFALSLEGGSVRILKQYRGESGHGIFKVYFKDAAQSCISVTHATAGNEEIVYTPDAFFAAFKKYVDGGGMLVNQAWAKGIVNGMVRCYITGTQVSGFGYQETVALCPTSGDPKDTTVKPISRRYYFSEDCGLFQDLRSMVQDKWIPQLQEIHAIPDENMPLLWDIDLFIEDAALNEKKYTLCEMNVSCVSPFPPSCVRYIVKALSAKLF